MKGLFAFIKKQTALLTAVLIGSVIGGATTALVTAAIPDSNGQINACYKNSTMVLRVTDPAGNCASNETVLSWQQSSGGQTISNRIIVPFEGASNQTIIDIPNLGQMRVGDCSQTTGIFLEYFNNSSHDVQVHDVNIPPNGTTNLTEPLLGYTSGGINYIADVKASLWVDDVTTQACYFQAQATLSQN